MAAKVFKGVNELTPAQLQLNLSKEQRTSRYAKRTSIVETEGR